MPLTVKSDVDAATTTWSTLLETCIKKPSYLYTLLPAPSFKKCGQLGSKRNVAKRYYSAMAGGAHRPITLIRPSVACNSFASGRRHLPLISCKDLGTADNLRAYSMNYFPLLLKFHLSCGRSSAPQNPTHPTRQNVICCMMYLWCNDNTYLPICCLLRHSCVVFDIRQNISWNNNASAGILWSMWQKATIEVSRFGVIIHCDLHIPR